MYVSIHVCSVHMSAVLTGARRGHQDPLVLDLKMLESQHVFDENLTYILFKNHIIIYMYVPVCVCAYECGAHRSQKRVWALWN